MSRFRKKMKMSKSKRYYRATVRPVKMNKSRRPGLKRGGIRL